MIYKLRALQIPEIFASLENSVIQLAIPSKLPEQRAKPAGQQEEETVLNQKEIVKQIGEEQIRRKKGD